MIGCDLCHRLAGKAPHVSHDCDAGESASTAPARSVTHVGEAETGDVCVRHGRDADK